MPYWPSSNNILCMLHNPQYSQELDRRKLLGQQYGRVLGTQLRILQSLEDKRQTHRIHFDALFKETMKTLEWIKALQSRRGSLKDAAEVKRYKTHNRI